MTEQRVHAKFHPPCKVCFRHTDQACSHTVCPNRKTRTAQVADGHQEILSAEGTYRAIPIRTH